jgi:hypothetical protein
LYGTVTTAAAWANVINPENRTAPEGGVSAYCSTADDDNGVVGLNVSGNLTDLVITIVRPNYLDLGQQETVTIDINQI